MSRIRQARRRAGLSQEELAEASGVSPATVVQAELGNRQPQGRTLRKLAAALGAEVAELIEEEEEAPKAQASPFEVDPERRRVAYVSAWSNFINEVAGDVEEWRYQWFSQSDDPADLPDHDFLLFIKAATPVTQVYQRASRTVREDLAPALRAEPPTGAMGREIETFERAFQRLSRVMLSVVTEGVARRVARMASREEAAGDGAHQAMPDNVVQLFTRLEEVA